jgi:hypothetical protein
MLSELAPHFGLISNRIFAAFCPVSAAGGTEGELTQFQASIQQTYEWNRGNISYIDPDQAWLECRRDQSWGIHLW